MIRTVIFDLDGTIADTIGALRSGMNLTMRRLGYPEKTREEIRASINYGARMFVKNCLPPEVREDEAVVERAFAVYEESYAETFRETDRLYDGMGEVMCELHRRGYDVAVFSNKQDFFVLELVKQLVPEGVCRLARGQRPGVAAKPDRAVSLTLCAELGVPPEACALVGDSHIDMRTAKNAGFFAVGVSWGYRPEVLAEEGAQCIVDRPEQLLELFPPIERRPLGMELIPVSEAEFDAVFDEMEANFPRDERRDRAVARRLLKEPRYAFFHVVEEGVRVGFITLWRLSDVTFLEHFVIYEAYRNRGVGARVIGLLQSRYARLLLEAEPPAEGMTARRVAFYERCGFVRSDYPYRQPAYRAEGAPVPLVLMGWPSLPDELRPLVQELYETVYETDLPVS